ncbi:LOW QUALITY PROTEIN: galactose oxidase, partial [Streptomyces sp. C]
HRQGAAVLLRAHRHRSRVPVGPREGHRGRVVHQGRPARERPVLPHRPRPPAQRPARRLRRHRRRRALAGLRPLDRDLEPRTGDGRRPPDGLHRERDGAAVGDQAPGGGTLPRARAPR